MKVITVNSGEYMRAHMFPMRRVGTVRHKRMQPTAEAQQRYNAKMAYHKLSDKVEANFTPNDWILTLTYDNEHLPADINGAMSKMTSYIRRLRRAIEKAGGSGADLKYINILQQGCQGGRLHHHFFLHAEGLTFEQITNIWGQGHVDARHLQYNENGLAGLVEYVLEGRATVKRWTCSQNLVDPKLTDYGSNALSKKEVRAINDNPTDFAAVEKMFPGWKVSAIEAEPGCPDALGLFVTVYLYRENNAYFRYGRHGMIDYSYKPREDRI